MSPSDKTIYGMAAEGKSTAEILNFIASCFPQSVLPPVGKAAAENRHCPGRSRSGIAKELEDERRGRPQVRCRLRPEGRHCSPVPPRRCERNMLHELGTYVATIKALENGLSAAQMKAIVGHTFRKSGGAWSVLR